MSVPFLHQVDFPSDPGPVETWLATGESLFLAFGGGRLVHINTQHAPRIEGEVQLPGEALAIQMHNDAVWVSTRPFSGAQEVPKGEESDLALARNLVAAKTTAGGLCLVRQKEDGALELEKTLGGMGAILLGKRHHLATLSDGLGVALISAEGEVVERVRTPDVAGRPHFSRLVGVGDAAYVFQQASRIDVFEWQDEKTPRHLKSLGRHEDSSAPFLGAHFEFKNIIRLGHHLVMTALRSPPLVLDVSDPFSPHPVFADELEANLAPRALLRGCEGALEKVWLSGSAFGFNLFRIENNPEQERFLGRMNVHWGRVSSLQVEGESVWVHTFEPAGAKGRAFARIDVQDPDHPRVKTLISLGDALPESLFPSGAFSSLKGALNEAGEVRTLDLSRLDLDEVPEEISALTQLEVLDLSQNRNLERLPDALGELTSLRVLNLHNSRNLAGLPASLERLVALEELRCSHTQLKSLPYDMSGMKSLKRLILSHSPIGRLPPSAMDCENLEELWADSCKVRELPKVKNLWPKLRKLSLVNCPIQEAPTFLPTLKHLEFFNVAGTKVAALPDFSALTSLRKLNIGHTAIATLPEGLEHCTHLEEINLSGAAIPEAEISAFKRARPGVQVWG
jgi:hypothetical protein